jgi:hypothetical protein
MEGKTTIYSEPKKLWDCSEKHYQQNKSLVKVMTVICFDRMGRDLLLQYQ